MVAVFSNSAFSARAQARNGKNRREVKVNQAKETQIVRTMAWRTLFLSQGVLSELMKQGSLAQRSQGSSSMVRMSIIGLWYMPWPRVCSGQRTCKDVGHIGA